MALEHAANGILLRHILKDYFLQQTPFGTCTIALQKKIAEQVYRVDTTQHTYTDLPAWFFFFLAKCTGNPSPPM